MRMITCTHLRTFNVICHLCAQCDKHSVASLALPDPQPDLSLHRRLSIGDYKRRYDKTVMIWLGVSVFISINTFGIICNVLSA